MVVSEIVEGTMPLSPALSSNIDIGEKLRTPYIGSKKALRIQANRAETAPKTSVAIISTSGVPFETYYLSPFRPFRRRDKEILIRPGDTMIFVTTNWTQEGTGSMNIKILELQAFDRQTNNAVFVLRDKYDYVGRNRHVLHYASNWIKNIAKSIRRPLKREIRRATL